MFGIKNAFVWHVFLVFLSQMTRTDLSPFEIQGYKLQILESKIFNQQ